MNLTFAERSTRLNRTSGTSIDLGLRETNTARLVPVLAYVAVIAFLYAFPQVKMVNEIRLFVCLYKSQNMRQKAFILLQPI